MITRAAVVAEAREWIGTPYHHQATQKGVGADCGGLVAGVAMALGIVPPTWWRDTFEPAFGGYGKQPFNGSLSRVCESFMARVHDEPAPGDVLLLRFAAEPQHMGIVADYRHGGLSMIHALKSVAYVTEHRFAIAWRDRVVGVYRMPGVE